ncbi:unnamed protein product, partial [Discosporangium mesarthrocarpum]
MAGTRGGVRAGGVLGSGVEGSGKVVEVDDPLRLARMSSGGSSWGYGPGRIGVWSGGPKGEGAGAGSGPGPGAGREDCYDASSLLPDLCRWKGCVADANTRGKDNQRHLCSIHAELKSFLDLKSGK